MYKCVCVWLPSRAHYSFIMNGNDTNTNAGQNVYRMTKGKNQYDVSSRGSINYLQFTRSDLIAIGYMEMVGGAWEGRYEN